MLNSQTICRSCVLQSPRFHFPHLMLGTLSNYFLRPSLPLRFRLRPRQPFHPSWSKMDSLRVKMSSLTPFQRKHMVTVVGSGNWYKGIHTIITLNDDLSRGSA